MPFRLGSPLLMRLDGSLDAPLGDEAPTPPPVAGSWTGANSIAYSAIANISTQGWEYNGRRNYTDYGDFVTVSGTSRPRTLTPRRAAYASDQENLRLAERDRLGFTRCQSYDWTIGEVTDQLGAWNGDMRITERGSPDRISDRNNPVNQRIVGGRPTPARTVGIDFHLFTGAPEPNQDVGFLFIGMDWGEQQSLTLAHALAQLQYQDELGDLVYPNGWWQAGYRAYNIRNNAINTTSRSDYDRDRGRAIASDLRAPSGSRWEMWIEPHSDTGAIGTPIVGSARMGVPSVPSTTPFLRTVPYTIGEAKTGSVFGVAYAGYYQYSIADAALATPTTAVGTWAKQIAATTNNQKAQICGAWRR